MKQKLTTIGCWALAAIALYAHYSFEMPEPEDLEPVKLNQDSQDIQFEEKENRKSGQVVGKTLHIYTTDKQHITVQKFLSHKGYNAIKNALTSQREITLYIWKKASSDNYGVYKATEKDQTILAYKTVKKLRSENVRMAKYLGFISLALGVISMIINKKKGESEPADGGSA